MKYIGWHKIIDFFGLKIKIKYKPKTKKVVNIIFDKNMGIGNRIFGLINVINYFCPKTINMYWPNQGWVSDTFNNLFEFEQQNIIEFNDLETFNLKTSTIKNSINISFPPCDLKTKKGTRLGQKYNKIKEKDKIEFREIFSKLKPNKKIENRLSKINLDNFIALQIRNSKDWEEYGRNENIEDFKQSIAKYQPNTIFYLSALNEEIKKSIQNNKHKIVELENKNYTSMEDAIVDLYMLSRAKEAIYSYGSTFSELAWWLGEAKQKVKIIGSDEKWKKIN